jgi:pyrroloquinoline quinone biosynthesis protein E
VFFDISQVRSQEDHEWIYPAVSILLGKARSAAIRPQLDFCIDSLAGRNRQLFQLGVMLGRQAESVRLFTNDLNREHLLAYLTDLHWPGDLAGLAAQLEMLEPFVSKFILDFDVTPHGISEKIGINFGLRRSDDAAVIDFLSFAETLELCVAQKREGVRSWLGAAPDPVAMIFNDISHFKLVINPAGAPGKLKAYLRQGSVPRREFAAFARPRMMNIELTTRCPLRCPQCYCDLSQGRDIDLETAKGFVRQAGALQMQQINLSGGETLVYPHLFELIECCREHGIRANVALSGYGFDAEALRKLRSVGVGGIFVSLNGSTEAVNRNSRDGYDLAIKALATLQQEKDPDYLINWVAHRHNVEDFPALIALAERCGVKTVVVMAFKPDSRHELPSLPSREQLMFLADFIKKYPAGPLKIGIESCFSPLRALVGQKFFVNLNRGIDKGCQAGRDSLSVSVDGKLTPCRHLEIEENFDSIAEYWQQSRVIGQLRTVERDARPPCQACSYERYCLHCMAVSWKMHGELFKGNDFCELNQNESR